MYSAQWQFKIDVYIKTITLTDFCRLGRENSNFLVEEGIVLGQHINTNGLEGDKAKVEPFSFDHNQEI